MLCEGEFNGLFLRLWEGELLAFDEWLRDRPGEFDLRFLCPDSGDFDRVERPGDRPRCSTLGDLALVVGDLVLVVGDLVLVVGDLALVEAPGDLDLVTTLTVFCGLLEREA